MRRSPACSICILSAVIRPDGTYACSPYASASRDAPWRNLFCHRSTGRACGKGVVRHTTIQRGNATLSLKEIGFAAFSATLV